MNKGLALEIYKFILRRMNGWSKEEIKEIEYSEIASDPLFKDLCELEGKNE